MPPGRAALDANVVSSADAVIIGAGPAGLAAAYELQRLGLTAVILEAEARVGEPWRRRHAQLRLNTHRAYSHQPGARIPRRFGAFPSRDQYVAYLQAYAQQFRSQIVFETVVERITRASDERWRLSTSRGSVLVRNVVVATGSDRIPYVPQWPGIERFKGNLLHAGEVRDVREYVGLRVLVVGAGNSAFDLGNHLARIDLQKAWLSVRRTVWVVPERVLGIPSHMLLVSGRWMPEALQDKAVAWLSRATVGDLSAFGLPPPSRGLFERYRRDGVTGAIDSGFVEAIRTERVEVVPEVERLADRSVRLSGGLTLEPDVIICATGYRLGLEPLVAHLGVLDEDGRPRASESLFEATVPGLWFFGLESSVYGNMNIRRSQARELAKLIRSRAPS